MLAHGVLVTSSSALERAHLVGNHEAGCAEYKAASVFAVVQAASFGASEVVGLATMALQCGQAHIAAMVCGLPAAESTSRRDVVEILRTAMVSNDMGFQMLLNYCLEQCGTPSKLNADVKLCSGDVVNVSDVLWWNCTSKSVVTNRMLVLLRH